MTGRSRKRPRDLNQLASSIVQDATEGTGSPDVANVEDGSRSSAQENGRIGGLKGGAARAAMLSPERRAEIARKAAQARWQ